MKIRPFRNTPGFWALSALLLAVGLYGGWPLLAGSGNGTADKPAPPAVQEGHLDLTDSQVGQIRVQTVEMRDFTPKQDAVGNIAFNDDRTVPVFPTYPGKITEISTDVGQDVKKGDPLFAVDSPDLLQAESTLIAAAGVRDLTARALERAQQLFAVEGIAKKDLQQAVSDQQSAEGAYQAARDAVRIFGKPEAQIDRIIAERRVDAALWVHSPISGRITARSAAPGVLAQPGTLPAPFTVADISLMWMVANVPETDLPALRLGQPVEVTLMAYPGQVFSGKITLIGASVDPNTHRALVRSEIRDPKHVLRPGMLANFVIYAGAVQHSPAVPVDSVVRENDGSMTVWVTENRHRFFKRTVTLGLQQDGWNQIVQGLQPKEMIATEGAVFLSHAYDTETH